MSRDENCRGLLGAAARCLKNNVKTCLSDALVY